MQRCEKEVRHMPRNHSNDAGRGKSVSAAGGGINGKPRGDAKTIEFLNLVLKNELTGINQYFLHSRMLADWGISEFSKHEYEESIDEMKHADLLLQRVLFLGGLPNLQYLDKLLIGENVAEIIDCDLMLEEKAIADLKDAIAYAESVRDYGSRELYSRIYENEEQHVDYLTTQKKLIANIGLTDYIQLQTQANAASALKAPE
jgi:bacterioferritin